MINFLKTIPFLFLALASCSPAKDLTTYKVASATTIGYGVAPQVCLLVKEGEASDWELFYSQIEGFDYQPGYEYVLQVQKTPVANPPADGSSIRYTLVKVVSKQAKQSEGLPPLRGMDDMRPGRE